MEAQVWLGSALLVTAGLIGGIAVLSALETAVLSARRSRLAQMPHRNVPAAEAMIEVGMHPWDLAAPLVLIEEAGGRVTDFAGIRSIHQDSFLASNGHLHEVLRAGLAETSPTGAS